MARLSTVAAFGFADFDPPTMLGLYRQLGCRSCQFYRNEDNPPRVGEAKRIADEAGLPFDSIHGVFGERYDPSSPDESQRRRTMETYRREADLTRDLVGDFGTPMVVVHPAAPIPEGEAPGEQERRGRLNPLRRSLEDLARMGQAAGVVYLIENVPFNCWCGQDPVELKAMLDELDSPHLQICFDTGHAMMTGTVADRLVAVGERVGYLHIHDNDGRVDDHRMPGEGEIDWPAVRTALAALPATLPAMLEVFHPAERLREMLEAGLAERLAAWLGTEHTATNPLR